MLFTSIINSITNSLKQFMNNFLNTHLQIFSMLALLADNEDRMAYKISQTMIYQFIL